jgi:hypothetical protein
LLIGHDLLPCLVEICADTSDHFAGTFAIYITCLKRSFYALKAAQHAGFSVAKLMYLFTVQVYGLRDPRPVHFGAGGGNSQAASDDYRGKSSAIHGVLMRFSENLIA